MSCPVYGWIVNQVALRQFVIERDFGKISKESTVAGRELRTLDAMYLYCQRFTKHSGIPNTHFCYIWVSEEDMMPFFSVPQQYTEEDLSPRLEERLQKFKQRARNFIVLTPYPKLYHSQMGDCPTYLLNGKTIDGYEDIFWSGPIDESWKEEKHKKIYRQCYQGVSRAREARSQRGVGDSISATPSQSSQDTISLFS